MSAELRASKVVVLENSPQVRTLNTGSSSVAGAVGVAEKGPFNQAVLCTSFERFQDTFGGFVAGSDLALGAMGYFENGGNRLWVSRVVSAASVKASAQLLASTFGIGDPAVVTGNVAPPFSLEDGAQLVVQTAAGTTTLTFNGTPAQVQDPSGTPAVEPFALADGLTLAVAVDGGGAQTVTFASADFADIGEATATEVANAINASLTGAQASVSSGAIVLTTTSGGTGSSLSVTGGTAVAATAAPATLLTTATFPVALANGDTLQITAAGTPYPVTFTGTPASTEDSLSEPYLLADGMTLTVAVNGGPAQTVTFHTADFTDIGAATAAEVATAIAAQLTGATATESPPGQFHIATTSRGTGSSLQVTGGTATTATALPAQILSSATFPVTLTNGAGLTITANGNAYPITFSGNPAVTGDPSAEPYPLVDAMTMTISVDGAGAQTVVFNTADFADIGAATADEVADAINAQISGAHATAAAGIFNVATSSRGTASTIQVTGGTAVSGTAQPAAILSAATFPVAVADGAGLTITANGTPYAITISGSAAVLQDTAGSPASEPYTLADGDSIDFTIDGGSPQTITFSSGQFVDIANATADEVKTAINMTLTGAVASTTSGRIVVTTTSKGTASSIAVSVSSASTALGLDDESATGGGNVASLAAVDWTEVAALLTAAGGDTDFTVSDTGTAIKFATNATGSARTIQASGTATTALGLDTTLHVGTDANRFGIPTTAANGSGNVASLAAVDWTEVATLLTAAGGDTDFTVSDTGTAIEFATNATGVSATLQASGSATTPLGLDTSLHTGVASNRFGLATSPHAGGGNVATLGAVTRAEVYTILNAAGGSSDFTVTDTGSAIRLATVVTGPTATLQASGTATTSLGIDINLQHGIAANVLGLRAQSGTGTGNVARLSAVTIAEVTSISAAAGGSAYFQVQDVGTGVRLYTVATGPSASIQVSGSAATPMGLDTSPHAGDEGDPVTLPAVRVDAIAPGTSENTLSVHVVTATSNVGSEFNLLVYRGATLMETFENLTRVSAAPRFVETIVNDAVNGSQLVRATNLTNAPGAPPILDTYALAGGVDGALTDSDFVGDPDAGTGLHALDAVDDLAILFVPGKATPTVHQGMLDYCETFRKKSVFAVLDPPAATTAAGMVTYVSTTASLEGASELGAIYWPRVRVLNPDKTVYGPVVEIVVPPSGIIAGVYSRTDAARPGGVYDQPAGIEEGRLLGVVGFETNETLEEKKRDLVYPHRINPLTTGPGLPRFIDGSRTLKGTGSFPFIAERRGTIFIERSLRKALEFARQKNNTSELRAQAKRTITAFLITQMQLGAFRSMNPAEAFSVEVSDTLNPPSVIFAGKLVARVGLATKKPAEFVILELSQDTRGYGV